MANLTALAQLAVTRYAQLVDVITDNDGPATADGKQGPAPVTRLSGAALMSVQGNRPATAGRKRGTPNKLTADVRTMILAALQNAGGTAYLALQATENPSAFLALVGKVLPLQVKPAEDTQLIAKRIIHIHQQNQSTDYTK